MFLLPAAILCPLLIRVYSVLLMLLRKGMHTSEYVHVHLRHFVLFTAYSVMFKENYSNSYIYLHVKFIVLKTFRPENVCRSENVW